MNIQLLLFRAAQYHVAKVLGVILFMASAGLGVSMIAAPDTFLSYSPLMANWAFASPMAWGTAFVVASLILVITVFIDADFAQIPALLLGAICILFGVITLNLGVSVVVWPFVALGWISIFTQVICWAEGKDEALLYSH